MMFFENDIFRAVYFIHLINGTGNEKTYIIKWFFYYNVIIRMKSMIGIMLSCKNNTIEMKIKIIRAR